MKSDTNSIIAKNDKLYPCVYNYDDNFFLMFHLLGNSSDFLNYDLPYPTYLNKINKGYLIAWAIEGKFNTNKNQAFLNDIIARFLITFADKKPERLPYKPKFENSKNAHVIKKAHRLKSFSQQLQSIKHKKFIPQRAESFQDLVFWAIKLHCEDLIREYKILSYEQVEDFAFTQFLATKDRSTLRAKCRNIVNYYSDRNYELPKRKKSTKSLEEIKMTRKDHIKAVHTSRKNISRDRVIMLLDSKKADEFKKKNGKWNAVAIAKFLKMGDKNVRAILKENASKIAVNKFIKED